jgi:diadenylate cyclase
VDLDALILMGDDPEKLLNEYEAKKTIIIYPKGKNPTASILLRNDVEIVNSDYLTSPDFSDLELVRDALIYLLNASYITSKDRVRVLFSKKGERHVMDFDLSLMPLPSLANALSDILDKELVEKIVKLSRSIVRKGREGNPAGALFIVGDSENVMKESIQKIANPMESISPERRNVLNEENFDTIREFAIMDGATIMDEKGYVIATGVYIKNLSIDDWVMEGGGRHLAAQSITKTTRAVSFAVSSEGTIRIYRDGKMIFELKDF